MKLEDIQTTVLAALNASAALSAATKVLEDGSYPQTPGREQALESPGLLLIVWQPDSEGLRSVDNAGNVIHAASCHVVIEENQAVNRAVGGANIPIQQAVRLVMEAVTGAGNKAARKQLIPLDPPFKLFGKQNGVNRAAVGFVTELTTLAA